MTAEKLEKDRCFLYAQAQLEEKVGEEFKDRYASLILSAKKLSADNHPKALSSKIKVLETLVCLQIQFGSRAEPISKTIRRYCEDLDLDLEESKGAMNGICSWFKSWVAAKWPFNLGGD